MKSSQFGTARDSNDQAPVQVHDTGAQTMATDALIQRAKGGESAAFSHLYHACVDQVHRQMAAIVGADPELDDLVQQTFVQVHRHLKSFRGEAQFETWVYRVGVNVALRHLKRRRRQAFWLQVLGQELPWQSAAPTTPEADLANKRQSDVVQSLLDELTPKKRIALLLYEVEGLTLAEIATRTGSPLFTVAARVRAARRELKRKLVKNLREPGPVQAPAPAKSRV